MGLLYKHIKSLLILYSSPKSSLFHIPMSVKWHCPKCKIHFSKSKKICDSCKAMTHYRCLRSNRSGLFAHYSRHKAACESCAPAAVKNARKRKRIEDIVAHEKGTTNINVSCISNVIRRETVVGMVCYHRKTETKDGFR